jgi:polyether ionophore transport system permease protein
VTTVAGAPDVRRIRRASSVVAALSARRAGWQGALWGATFGVVVYGSVTGYTSAYPTVTARRVLQSSIAVNPGAQALLGPAHHLETVAGFTAWRAMGSVMLVGAVWGILASTKQLRGEEDAGRWEILLAGPTTRVGAALQAMAGLAAGLLAMFLTTASAVVLTGRTADAQFTMRSSLFFTVALVSSAALFLAVGALTSQIASDRRHAATLAAAIFGLAFVARMVAAMSTDLAWLRWASPLGWIDELHPLTGSQPIMLIPIALMIAGLVAATALLAGRRDLGASALVAHDERTARTTSLQSAIGLDVRLVAPTAAGWLLGIGSLALVLGLVAKVASRSMSGSARIREILKQLGAHRTGAVSYLGFSFVIIATLVALAAAGQVAATRDEEGEGRVDHLLVRAVSRRRWLAGRLAVATAVIVSSAVVAGLLAWVGAALQDSGVGARLMLEAGANVAGPAMLVLGFGTLLHGVWPRAASVGAYALVAWSFLVEVVGALIKADHWILDSSVLHHIRPAPAAPIEWTSVGVLVALGVGAAVIGLLVFERRDLANA